MTQLKTDSSTLETGYARLAEILNNGQAPA